jgi:hypothetical protein
MAAHTRSYSYGDQNLYRARHYHLNTIMSNGNQSSSGVLNEEQLEQYRLMAQIEANVRVRDNTGFDREEYERQLKEERNSSRIRPRPVSFFATADPRPRPSLPEIKIYPNNNHTRQSSSSIGSRIGSGSISGSTESASLPQHGSMSGSEAAAIAASSAAPVLSNSSSFGQRPEEPHLPPRRANERFVKHPRTPKIDELCDGMVVQLPDGTPVTAATTTVMEESEEEVKREEAEELLQHSRRPSPLSVSHQSTMNDTDDPHHVVVDCWGCGCRLRAHRLASLVKCSHCLTVSPSIHKDR